LQQHTAACRAIELEHIFDFDADVAPPGCVSLEV
jgi:hypothetical protein